MASSRKDIKRITDREIEKVNIANLADRPTSGSRYGVGVFDAKALKERFDKFPALIKDRFNAVVDALTSADAPKYITLDGSIAGVDNLFDFLLLFCEKTAGEKNISDYIQALYTDIQNAQASSKTLQDIINDMASWLAKLKEESAVHSGKISDAEKRLDKNDERLEDIEDYINDMVTVENSNAYLVPVPKDSRSKANVLSVGGMTYKSKNLFDINRTDFVAPNELALRYPPKVENGILYSGGIAGSSAGSSVPIALKQNTEYTFSLNVSYNATVETTAEVMFVLIETPINGMYDTSKRYVLGYAKKQGLNTVTFNSRAYSHFVLVAYSTNRYGIAMSEIMLSEGKETVYRPYFSGLRNAAVEKVKSRGAQLIPFPYETSSLTQDGLTFIANSDGTITINGTHTGTASANFILLGRDTKRLSIPAGTYTLSAFPKEYIGTSRIRALVYTSGDTATSFDVGSSSKTMTFDTSTSLVILLFVKPGETLNNLIAKPMLNVGTTAAPFEPFKPDPIDSITIPESVQNLEGYGLGLNDEYKNTANLEKKKYQRLVGEVDLGTLDWTYENPSFSAMLSDIKPTASGDYQARKTGFLCAKYNPSSNVDYTAMDDKSILRREFKKIHIRDSAYTDAAEFKAAMAGVMLVYELADPQEIDISSLFTADNEIKVSENGYLEFENEYQYPVPSSIEWAIYSSHKVAFEHANTIGNPHRTTAAEVGAISREEAERDFIHLVDGKIPSSILPSYVDDVLEYDTKDDFPETGESGKIYIDLSTNKSHRWSGTAYVELTSSALILGTTSETAFRGDLGKIAYDHSQTKGNPHGTTMDEILPVTASDNGKFLRVADGKWSAVTIATAEGGSF